MQLSSRKWWTVFKALLTLAILFMIGRQFWRDLRNPELWQHAIDWQWLLASGLFYILGLGFTVVYWYRLLWSLGQRPGLGKAVRAHYTGQMGKYLPGKAWALVLRASLVRGPEVSMRIAILTSFYEVFTVMASGSLLAAVVFAVHAGDASFFIDWQALHQLITLRSPATPVFDHKAVSILAVLMLLIVGIPILPPVFNRLVKRLMPKLPEMDDAPVPRINPALVVQGLLLTSGCWVLFGASLWAALRSLFGDSLSFTLETLAHYSAYIALAYVAGFLIIIVPSGLGVREFFLTLFLVPELLQLEPAGTVEWARSTAVLAVVALRIVWTAMELIVVGLLYWLSKTSLLSASAGPVS